MRSFRPILLTATALLASQASALTVSDAKLGVSYLYSLSSTTGTLPLAEVKMSWDAEFRELWVVSGSKARVFNAGGMETFSFGASPEFGAPFALAPLPDSDLVVLSADSEGWRLARCNFRGEFKALIEVTGAPAKFFEDAPPSVVQQAGGKLYLVSFNGMRVLVTDLEGRTVGHRDLAEELDLGKKRADYELGGFSAEADGTLLFTVPTLFTAYIAPPAGALIPFGVKGSAPGKFQVIAGIGRDPNGFVYVTDVLKSAVIAFDRDLNFVTEFGYRGRKASNLVAPQSVVVAEGRLFVSQRAKRGVSVFKVSPLAKQQLSEVTELSEAQPR